MNKAKRILACLLVVPMVSFPAPAWAIGELVGWGVQFDFRRIYVNGYQSHLKIDNIRDNVTRMTKECPPEIETCLSSLRVATSHLSNPSQKSKSPSVENLNNLLTCANRLNSLIAYLDHPTPENYRDLNSSIFEGEPSKAMKILGEINRNHEEFSDEASYNMAKKRVFEGTSEDHEFKKTNSVLVEHVANLSAQAAQSMLKYKLEHPQLLAEVQGPFENPCDEAELKRAKPSVYLPKSTPVRAVPLINQNGTEPLEHQANLDLTRAESDDLDGFEEPNSHLVQPSPESPIESDIYEDNEGDQGPPGGTPQVIETSLHNSLSNPEHLQSCGVARVFEDPKSALETLEDFKANIEKLTSFIGFIYSTLIDGSELIPESHLLKLKEKNERVKKIRNEMLNSTTPCSPAVYLDCQLQILHELLSFKKYLFGHKPWDLQSFQREMIGENYSLAIIYLQANGLPPFWVFENLKNHEDLHKLSQPLHTYGNANNIILNTINKLTKKIVSIMEKPEFSLNLPTNWEELSQIENLTNLSLSQDEIMCHHILEEIAELLRLIPDLDISNHLRDRMIMLKREGNPGTFNQLYESVLLNYHLKAIKYYISSKISRLKYLNEDYFGYYHQETFNELGLSHFYPRFLKKSKEILNHEEDDKKLYRSEINYVNDENHKLIVKILHNIESQGWPDKSVNLDPQWYVDKKIFLDAAKNYSETADNLKSYVDKSHLIAQRRDIATKLITNLTTIANSLSMCEYDDPQTFRTPLANLLDLGKTISSIPLSLDPLLYDYSQFIYPSVLNSLIDISDDENNILVLTTVVNQIANTDPRTIEDVIKERNAKRFEVATELMRSVNLINEVVNFRHPFFRNVHFPQIACKKSEELHIPVQDIMMTQLNFKRNLFGHFSLSNHDKESLKKLADKLKKISNIMCSIGQENLTDLNCFIPWKIELSNHMQDLKQLLNTTDPIKAIQYSCVIPIKGSDLDGTLLEVLDRVGNVYDKSS